ncbi:sulfite exporter TauE/SafE family protein 3-like isoform X1 [Papaver somniferum]|uniref:sulfite exporter TauE/SafE family protein 3-like isoform X1 n=2 Tax=Papaver somniferum TaxID=3469 RepID=UPI000E6F5C5E|nr:sulfite exporter TauE/SafE family protein 3-like isoform X1 [Papaver somniferum]
MEVFVFGWRIIVGSIIGFLGGALGSIGGGGGGGIFVPMLIHIIGFDPKSSAPISKCMGTGGALATVYYNLKRRHPTLDMPIMDYNLALLIQPMLMLGISIGVSLRLVFPDWIVTILLFILVIGPLTLAILNGRATWKKETILKKDGVKCLEYGTAGEESGNKSVSSSASCGTSTKTNSVVPFFANERIGSEGMDQNSFPSCPSNGSEKEANPSKQVEVPIFKNSYWREIVYLVFIWVAFLLLQIAKSQTTTCSVLYWVLSSMQIPISVGGSLYQAVNLYKGVKVIPSMGVRGTAFKKHQLILYCLIGLLAGMVGELLRLGAGFILVPFFLELGIVPQVSSATSTFVVTFSASMSAIEFYYLRPFPIPYALYFLAVAGIGGFVGQIVGRKMVTLFRRPSIIIFVVVFTISVTVILLGGIGIANMTEKIELKPYLGFQNLCRKHT